MPPRGLEIFFGQSGDKSLRMDDETTPKERLIHGVPLEAFGYDEHPLHFAWEDLERVRNTITAFIDPNLRIGFASVVDAAGPEEFCGPRYAELRALAEQARSAWNDLNGRAAVLASVLRQLQGEMETLQAGASNME